MPGPLPVLAIIDAAPDQLARLRIAVGELARHSIAEPGCLRYEVQVAVKNPARLIIHEIWADESALADHGRSQHVAAFKAAISGTETRVWASPLRPLSA